MSVSIERASPYTDVNDILSMMLSRAQSVLGNNLLGFYLHGSLAMGDFNADSSDIDFVVVTKRALSDDEIMALKILHTDIAASDSKWGKELEGSYIPKDALRRYNPANAMHAHIESGTGRLVVEQHDTDWVVQRHILREYGLTLLGPPISTLIDPVGKKELKTAIYELLLGWWAPMVDHHAKLHHPGYRVYAVLTMCRILYTFEHGDVVSKPKAGRWAMNEVAAQHISTVEGALAWPSDIDPVRLEDAKNIIKYTLEKSEQLDLSTGP